MAPTISISDLGPVASAEVELKPLTILVGPNNSGKSHVALAVYAVSQALQDGPRLIRDRRFSWRTRRTVDRLGGSLPERGEAVEAIRTLSAEQLGWTSEKLDLDKMPSPVKRALTEMSRLSAQQYCGRIGDELQRCFGSNLQNLARRSQHTQEGGFTLKLTNESSGFLWGMRNSGENKLITSQWTANLAGVQLSRISSFLPIKEALHEDPDFFLYFVARQYMDHLLEGHSAPSYYLPATRSAILQGHKTLSSLIVDRASWAWVEPLNVPELPGVTTDLIRSLLMLGNEERQGDPKLSAVVEFLEAKVTKGNVEIDTQVDYPDIYYANDLGRFALHNISSMISEIAPLVLFLKFLIRKNVLLIYEEPESHLDPSNQRNVARAIAMMVNAGVNVIVTTHSDIFVNQINNLTQLGAISSELRQSMGYEAAEILRGEDIGVYLFKPEAKGTVVESVEVNSEYGIPTESSDEIHRALYEEAIELEHQASQ